MEVVKSRYGADRSIERIDFKRILVMGESEFCRHSVNNKGVTTLFDFEGGPCYTLGGKIPFEGLSWKITGIKAPYSGETEFMDLRKVVLEVEPIY